MSRTREQLKKEHDTKIAIMVITIVVVFLVICSVISVYHNNHYYDLYTYLPEGYEIVYESHEIQPQETVESIVQDAKDTYNMKVPGKVMIYHVDRINGLKDVNNIHAGNYILVPVFKPVK